MKNKKIYVYRDKFHKEAKNSLLKKYEVVNDNDEASAQNDISTLFEVDAIYLPRSYKEHQQMLDFYKAAKAFGKTILLELIPEHEQLSNIEAHKEKSTAQFTNIELFKALKENYSLYDFAKEHGVSVMAVEERARRMRQKGWI